MEAGHAQGPGWFVNRSPRILRQRLRDQAAGRPLPGVNRPLLISFESWRPMFSTITHESPNQGRRVFASASAG
jgi:hypothetical protein